MDFDFADIKPTVFNWAIVGLMAVTFISFFKWFFSRYDIPGTSGIEAIFASI